MVAEFRDYVIEQRVRFDDTSFKSDVAFVKAMIKFEADADLFGIEEARRNLTKVDPQVQAAVGFFGEAADLLTKKTSAK
jgi:hypothetical protein